MHFPEVIPISTVEGLCLLNAQFWESSIASIVGGVDNAEKNFLCVQL